MDIFDKMTQTVTRKAVSWILLLIFNVYLLFHWIAITGPEILDGTILICYGYVLLLLLSAGRKEAKWHLGDSILFSVIAVLLLLPVFLPQQLFPFLQLPISKHFFGIGFYYVVVFLEAFLLQNVIESHQKESKETTE